MMDDYCTPQEAAGLLGVSRQSIYSMSERYSWETKKVGPARLFLRSDVLATPTDETVRRSHGQLRRRAAPETISTDISAPAEKAKPAPKAKRKRR